MVFCFGTVCWNGYLDKYIDIFTNNYIMLYRKLINLGVNHCDIAEPKICYNNDIPGLVTENSKKRIMKATGKELQLICDKRKYTNYTVMYYMRNRLRSEFRKSYPTDKKVFFYFPIDDNLRPEIAIELLKLSSMKEPSACMFKFAISGVTTGTASTRPIRSYKDIHPEDWGGYCAYTILDENKCPLYPSIAIPNIAFYAELYRAGYNEYQSNNICIDHLRHSDSHHFKTKDKEMSRKVRDFLLQQQEYLCENGYK